MCISRVGVDFGRPLCGFYLYFVLYLYNYTRVKADCWPLGGWQLVVRCAIIYFVTANQWSFVVDYWSTFGWIVVELYFMKVALTKASTAD